MVSCAAKILCFSTLSTLSNTVPDALLSELRGLLPDVINTEPTVLQSHGLDMTRAWEPTPTAVAFVRSTEHVQTLVKFANAHNIGLVPSGGRTGHSGAAVAANGEIVVSFDKMNRIGEFNAIDRTVVCEPGVITQQLHEFAEAQGLFYPVDFAATGSSQLGGNIATNAGGIKVIRWGMTREWVAGLKVVTGTGDILELNRGLAKNNSGYDLRQLFIGSEGTLGFIVEATMQLCSPPKELSVMVLGCNDFSAVMSTFNHFQNGLDLTAFEFFSDAALGKVVKHRGHNRPFGESTPFYGLIEFEQDDDTAMTLFEHCVEQGWVLDGVLSQSLQQAQDLWALREDISETLSHYTPYKNDLAVKPSKVPAYLEAVDRLVHSEYPNFEIIWFGHIGDGNLHLNILKPDDLDKGEFFARCGKVSEKVFDITRQFGGTISAEHGVGLLKKPYLEFSRSSAEIAIMRQIKAVFDPRGIMNPGKVFD